MYMEDKLQSVDTNINNYTYPELLIILNIDDPTNTDVILEKTNKYIDEFTENGNNRMRIFFKQIQTQLLDYAEQLLTSNKNAEFRPVEEQTNEWLNNKGALPQKNTNQKDKLTNRFQEIGVYNNSYVPMSRNQLGVNNTYNLDVMQDGKLNPTMKNTTQRLIVLDSFYRQEAETTISTDYTLDLSDHLKQVLSLRLWSIEIPLTYYNIDNLYGNNCFWIRDGTNNINISLPSGNYNPTTFVNVLKESLLNANFTFTSDPVTYSATTYKITFDLYGGSYNAPLGSDTTSFIINEETELIFFDASGKLFCGESCNTTMHINETLGWIMGFHNESGSVNINEFGNIGDAILDLTGSRYFILVIDDYNQNHVNNSLVTITDASKIVKLPSYYANGNSIIDNAYVCEPQDFGVVPQLTPNAPRKLTRNQLYTINEILKNNVNNTDIRAKAPTTSDVFAIIPIKNQGSSSGSLYVDFSGQLQDNRRIYFGPVEIKRMRVRLLNDKGHVLNLNGGNWSVSLMAENLYQY
jgi:hypothetical protein